MVLLHASSVLLSHFWPILALRVADCGFIPCLKCIVVTFLADVSSWSG